VVVKNSPFVVSLTASPAAFGQPDMRLLSKYFTNGELDLGKLAFDCRLLYDTENGAEKEVDFVENKPFQFRVNVVEGGKQVDIEVRLKVLSSQHEDMFFVIRFIALDPITKREISPFLVVHSLPIKVISKPEQLKKRRPSKKRTLNDMLIDALTRIERNQQTQQQLLDQLAEGSGLPLELLEEEADDDSGEAEGSEGEEGENLDTNFSQSMDGVAENYHPQHPQEPQLNMSDTTPGIDSNMDFEEALENLLQKFTAAARTERETKIQRVLQSSPLSRENLVELYDLFISEGLQPPSINGVEGGNLSVSGECTCSACPHKAELERIEGFYRDVFHL